MRSYFLTFLILLALFQVKTSFSQQVIQPNAKYVFYFIGDGFGLAQSYLAELYLAEVNHQQGIKKLEMNQLPITGFYTDYANNRPITCSAAAGTALATGVKTSINTIGMNTDRTLSLKTIAEIAHQNGFKVGIITSVSPDHATPAAFYAHQPDRNNYYEISIELANSGFDFFAGGDFRQALPGNNSSSRINSKKLALQNGYKIVQSLDQFKLLNHNDGKAILLNPECADGMSLQYAIDQKNGYISLADYTEKGIEMLYPCDTGFFMMVEGGKIDWACHRNDIGTTLHEVIDFDKAISVAIKFYNNHPDETLIVICSDHETGGLAIGYAGTAYELYLQKLQYQKISSEKFEFIIQKYYKSGISSKKKYAELKKEIAQWFGLGVDSLGLALTLSEEKELHEAFESSMQERKIKIDDDQAQILYGAYDPLAIAVTRILSHKAGLDWTTFDHTGIPLPIRAIGPGQEKFTGYFDNTDIPKKILEIMGLPFPN